VHASDQTDLPAVETTTPPPTARARPITGRVLGLLGLALSLAMPALLPSYLLLTVTISLTLALSAIGLSLLVGSTNQASLGHSAFMGIGAYTTTLLAVHAGVPFELGLIAGAVLAGVGGVLIGIPTLRLHGPYLALATLGFALAVGELLKRGGTLTGGSFGIAVPRGSLLGLELSSGTRLYYVVLACLLVGWCLTWQLSVSMRGLRWKAIGQSNIAAQSFGINLARSKTAAFAFSGVLAGIAGAFYAQAVGYLVPESFGLFLAVALLAIVVVGGAGSYLGTVVAVLALNIPQQLASGVRALPAILYGGSLLLVLAFVPKGIGPPLERLWRRVTGRG
jgi:branched-chain amino acid transport system permease protein